MRDKNRETMLTPEFLLERATRAESKGFKTQKWVIFCQTLLQEGFTLRMYEASNTVSKYIYVTMGKKTFKVRFSNHKPSWAKESEKDCDFFVGFTHTGVRNTDDALVAVKEYFYGDGDVGNTEVSEEGFTYAN